jgi:hypothetical protein
VADVSAATNPTQRFDQSRIGRTRSSRALVIIVEFAVP